MVLPCLFFLMNIILIFYSWYFDWYYINSGINSWDSCNLYHSKFFCSKVKCQGAKVAQSVKCLTLDFNSERDLKVIRLIPAPEILSLPLPIPFTCAHSLFLKKKKVRFLSIFYLPQYFIYGLQILKLILRYII